jgi:hypothetical protein
MSGLFTICIFVFLAAVTRQVLMMHSFFKYLDEAHPRTYAALGYPRWRFQVGNVVLRNAIKYIHDRGFESLGDAKLETLYRSIKFAERLAVIAAASALFIALYQALSLS